MPDQPRLSATVERRFIDLEIAEFRVDSQSEDPMIRGYAAVFDALSVPLFGFREIIRKGAFKKSIRDHDIRALWNHDANFVLGRKSARTLRLEEDDKGLKTRITPPETTWARDLLVSMDRGDVSQMSFGFRTIKDRWTAAGEDGLPVRELVEVQLFDVSPVTFPAYPQTEVHVRAFMDALIWKQQHGGGLSTEERAAIGSALENLKQEFTPSEPGQPHSDEAEPGQPHSIPEPRRTIQEMRLRLLQLLEP